MRRLTKQSIQNNLINILCSRLLHFLLVFFFLSGQIFAQEVLKPKNYSVQAGFSQSSGGSKGVNFSFHYAIRTQKTLQLESKLFYERTAGSGFGFASEEINGYGLLAGIRINILPERNFNPSIVVMTGIVHSTFCCKVDSKKAEQGIWEEYVADATKIGTYLGVSSTFYQKHMASLGGNIAYYVISITFKYGYWF